MHRGQEPGLYGKKCGLYVFKNGLLLILAVEMDLGQMHEVDEVLMCRVHGENELQPVGEL
ncbi:MAG: hypothetical protein ACK559_31725 [bacterium]